MFLAVHFSGCQRTKNTPNEEVSSFNSHSKQSVCCARRTSKGTFYKTKSCDTSTHEQTINCCEKEFLGILKRDTLGYYPFACDEAPQEALSQVALCQGPTRFRQGNKVIGGVSDAVSGLSKFAHNWIKTSNVEVGMGPKEWQKRESLGSAINQLEELFDAVRLDKKVMVSWRDHSGYSEVEGSQCERLFFCDEKCVENELTVGKTLGVYSLINQCQSSAVEVLRKCGCYDHCKKWLGKTCVDRAFPPLKGLNLNSNSTEESSQ